jgi:hypothetical protein
MATILIPRGCDHRHSVCQNNLNYFKKSMVNLTKVNFDKFIDAILINGHYTNCLATYSNKNSEILLDFIVLASGVVEITLTKFILLSQFISSDDKLILIITNQLKLNSNYKNELITCKTIKSQYGGNQLSFMSICFNLKKMNTIKFMMENMDINSFFDMIVLIKDSVSTDCEKFLCDYITKNGAIIKTKNNVHSLIDSFINKPKILKSIYMAISPTLTPVKKLEILNKIVLSNTLEPSLILIILEGNDILPDNTTITNLLSRVYFRNVGASNAKIIAEIVDIFILYGFKITKEMVIQLLKKGCYVNLIEKYPIPIDESILEECAEIGYYPYDFTCIPPIKVILKECGKENNLEQIKRLKEKGGVITVRCLEKACGVKRNGRVLKYIINDCNVKPDNECLEKFQITYGIEALDILMMNYSNKKDEIVKSKNKIDLDNDSTMTVEKRLIEISPGLEYTLKTKIKKLLEYKKKTIKYVDLYELMLKYLINHKLVIGNYFVINNELCNLLKISQCTLVNIDQLDNILSYFIDIVI